jgi:ubiquinone/menaquinone biosynthesis C-methylase UbiE
VAEISARLPRFDRVARVYRAMEHLSFGPMLERCRFHHIPALTHARRALVLGDGDGRFVARLLRKTPHLHADAVDGSPVMLRLLRDRVSRLGAGQRLTTLCADARAFEPPSTGYDLVVMHFFLDCLTEQEADDLIYRLRPHLAPGVSWLVSEFQVPATGAVRRGLARLTIAGLYAAFGLLTGLRVREIPPWRALLIRYGFRRRATRRWLGGLLVSELWEGPGNCLERAALPPEVTLTTQHGFRFVSGPGIDPGPTPYPGQPPVPTPDPTPGPRPDPDPEPWPGPVPTPQPVTCGDSSVLPAKH